MGTWSPTEAQAAKGKRVTRQTVIRILQAHRDEAVRYGWDDDDVPEVPGNPTTLQKLKRIWRRASVDERRQFKWWATRLERARKARPHTETPKPNDTDGDG